MATVTIKQFQDKSGNKVAGKTPEHAVYDTDGVRLDDKLDKIEEHIYPRILKTEDELNALIEAGGPFEEGYDYVAYEDTE